MAVYRNIQTTFWTDAKVADEFTPEDKYFYLYLFTNPHTNLSGCYEISKKQVSWETGYSIDTIDRLLERFEKIHQVISFNQVTKEVLLLNWHKYNWTASEKFRKPLLKEIESIKCDEYREYLIGAYSGDMVSIRYPYGMDTTVTVTVSDTVSVTDADTVPEKPKKTKMRYSDDDALDDAIKDFIEHRRKLRKPMTDKAIELLINKLNKLAPNNTSEKVELINTAIESGWQTVYPRKKDVPEKNSNLRELEALYMNE